MLCHMLYDNWFQEENPFVQSFFSHIKHCTLNSNKENILYQMREK